MADAPETSSAAVSPVAEVGSADAAKKQSWALPRELPKLPGLPEMPELPELPELPKLPKLEMPTPPSTVLAQQLAKDWGWLLQLELPFFDDGQLHTFVSTKRRTVSSVMESIDSSIQRASSTLEWMQEPSPLIGRWWARTLEWRRKSPALVVAAITAASVAPGIVLRSPRIVFRNSVIGATLSSVLFYPEFVMRTAPFVAEKASQLESRAQRAAHRER